MDSVQTYETAPARILIQFNRAWRAASHEGEKVLEGLSGVNGGADKLDDCIARNTGHEITPIVQG